MADLRLRQWNREDASALLHLYRSHEDLSRQLPLLADSDAAAAWINVINGHGYAMLALTLGDEPVGNVGASGIDPRHQTAWFSYWMGASRGRGFMGRAAASAASWLLTQDQFPIFRLELGARLNNPASLRVAECAGFHREGIERSKLSYGYARFDVVTMSRLRTDPRPSTEPVPITWRAALE